MPEITLFLSLSLCFFPNWEHFGCLPLDGYTESSFAGSRGTQPLTTVGNFLGVLFFFSSSFLSHSLTMWCSWASQAKRSCSAGFGESHCLGGACSESNARIHLIPVSFSAAFHAKATLTPSVPKGTSWALCAADLNAGPCYVADRNPRVNLCKFCSAGDWAIGLQQLILDLCLVDHLQYHCDPEQVGAHEFVFPTLARAAYSSFPPAVGAQRVPARVQKPARTALSCQYFLNIGKLGEWIYTRSAFWVMW